ncbi:glycosyl transferase family A [cyanobiont of Ornithocercus magnificus]|nr:glycosyl transferase family A [cyanobiont of Ornithocercus magnificus]
MYTDLSSVWEGWSKNWFLALDRNIAKALGAGVVVVIMFSSPWLLLFVSLALLPIHLPQDQFLLLTIVACLVGLGLQLSLRVWVRRQFLLPLKYYWLAGIGGLLVGAIAANSVWCSLTGIGWTWKGRPLKVNVH